MVIGLARVAAGLWAALFASWFGLRLWTVLPLFALFTSEPAAVGAVSVGITSGLGVEVLIFLAAIVANRAIVRWAQRSAALVRKLHLAHSRALVAIPLLILAWVGLVVGGVVAPGGWIAPIALLMIPALFIGQLAVVAALLAAYAWEPRGPAIIAR